MKTFIEENDAAVQRFLEILPGLLAWSIILLPVWGAFIMPQLVAYIVLGFIVFWFYRSFSAAILGLRGYRRIRAWEKIDWGKKYQEEAGKDSLPWGKIRHIVVIPTYNESAEKISSSLETLTNQKGIAKKSLAVVLSFEERAPAARERAEVILEKFAGKFGHFWATFHPDGLPGEIRGKAANEAWGAKEAKKKLVDETGWDIKKTTLTSADADARFHPHYFAGLTFAFASNPNRYLRFWQSPIFWYNNLHRVPAPIKIVGVMGNIIHIANLQEPDGLFFNYSTYSSSLALIDDIGYWHRDIIPEDWHIFLQAFFHKEGKVEVEPLFLPTHIDAPEGQTYLGSLRARYEQCKRHAWGATDIPYAVKQFFKHPEIPLAARFLRIFKLFETHLIWSTNWFLLTLGATLPVIVNPVFARTALGYQLPSIARMVLTVCLLALLTMILLDRALRPKREKKPSLWQTAWEYGQWVMMPLATLFMSVLPGLDAQTRLMFGRNLEYRPTEKV